MTTPDKSYLKIDLFSQYPSMLLSLLSVGLSIYTFNWGISYESQVLFDLTSVSLIVLSILLMSFPVLDWINFIKTYRKERGYRIIIKPSNAMEINGDIITQKDIKSAIHYRYLSRRLSPLDLEYVKLNLKNGKAIIISELMIKPEKLVELLNLQEKYSEEYKNFYHLNE